MNGGEKIFQQKLEYIHNNPVRRDYVDDTVHWRYSSAGDDAGERGLFELTGLCED